MRLLCTLLLYNTHHAHCILQHYNIILLSAFGRNIERKVLIYSSFLVLCDYRNEIIIYHFHKRRTRIMRQVRCVHIDIGNAEQFYLMCIYLRSSAALYIKLVRMACK